MEKYCIQKYWRILVVGSFVPLFVLSSNAVLADNLYASHFMGGNEKACYGRVYSGEHLAKHTKQKVRIIALREISETRSESLSDVVSFDLIFGAVGRTKPSKYSGVAYCQSKGTSATCHIEADGGRFTLAPNEGGNGLVLKTNGLGFEGESDFFHFGNKSDDKVFYVEKTSSDVCDEFQ